MLRLKIKYIHEQKTDLVYTINIKTDILFSFSQETSKLLVIWTFIYLQQFKDNVILYLKKNRCTDYINILVTSALLLFVIDSVYK